MANSICVCCGNKAIGIAIAQDEVIRGLRGIKRALGFKAQNNKLVWCKACYGIHVHASKEQASQKSSKYPIVVLEQASHPGGFVERAGYEKSRKAYESRQITYLAIGIIFGALGIILSPSIASVLFGIVIVAFLYLMSLLSYAPRLEVSGR